MVARTQEEK